MFAADLDLEFFNAPARDRAGRRRRVMCDGQDASEAGELSLDN
jgi:hypothetical protein